MQKRGQKRVVFKIYQNCVGVGNEALATPRSGIFAVLANSPPCPRYGRLKVEKNGHFRPFFSHQAIKLDEEF